jgi:peroxiredoxin
MNKQWGIVIVVVLVLAGGTWQMVRSAPASIQLGVAAPDFTATDLATDKPVTLYQKYANKVTLVNIWATWCDPCKEEIPALDSLYVAMRDKGFHIAAVSIDVDGPEVVRKFARDYHISFDVLQDRAGTIKATYQTTGVPESFLIDKHGRIVRMVPRAHPWNSPESRHLIETLLAEPQD